MARKIKPVRRWPRRFYVMSVPGRTDTLWFVCDRAKDYPLVGEYTDRATAELEARTLNDADAIAG